MRAHKDTTESSGAVNAEVSALTPEQRDTTTTTVATTADWSGWERWLRRRLDNALAGLHAALGKLLATERRKFADQLERKTNEFEVRLAKLSGAVDVLRGAAPPPPAKFPSVKAWNADTICHEGDVVAFAGGTFQALRDTAQPPGSQDWVPLAVAGAGFAVRGKYLANEAYHRGDVVMLDGASFVATKDTPGVCPGDGWRLFAMRGARGRQGSSGQHGLMGLRGERGQAAPGIQSWSVDRERYTATPIMSDGSIGPTLDLRGLFEQFLLETNNG